MKRMLALLALALATASAATAQEAEATPVLTADEEVALARSAAPAEVSAGATVYVLRDGRYEVAVHGSSAVSSLVGRSHPASLEPICYDEEASRTILHIERASVEMRWSGMTEAEVDATIESMIDSGELTLPERAAMAYMMSPDQVLYADAETRVGSWKPHYHLYMPYVTARAFGGVTDETVPGVGSVAGAGTATASLVIVAEAFTGTEEGR